MGGSGEMSKYQFYFSANITLNDAEPLREQQNSNTLGAFAIKDTVVRNRIKISKNAMGVILNSYTDADNLLVVEICFEDDDSKRIFFKQAGPGMEHKFFVIYKEPRKRIIDYGGEPYVLSYSGGEPPFLRIKILRQKNEKINTRWVRGRRVQAGDAKAE